MAAPENPQLSQPVALYYLRCLELLIYHRLQALNANSGESIERELFF